MGERFAYCESISGGFDFDRKYIDAIKSLNLDKLYEIREKYFQPNSFVCGGIVPKGEKLPQSLKKSFSKSGIKKLNSKPLSKKSPKVKEFEHKGLKVILRPIEHLDLFSMRWVGLGGTRLESRKKAGLGSLWARTVNEGGRNADGNLWSQERINECIDRSCSSLSAVHGRNSWGLYLDGMAGDFDELFQMTSSLLHEPLFEKATIKLEKKHQIEDLITRSENPTAVLFQQFNQAMFGKQHAYGRSTLGSKKDIRERNREELVTYHKKLLNSPQVLCVVGQVSEQDIIHSLERYWSHKKKFNKKSDLRKIQKPQTPKKKIYAYENLPKEQCHILWGFPTCRVNHPDRWALHALNALLAGQSGRLFMELRDKLSLCYTVSASQMESLDGGYFGFYIGTSPEKKDQALEAMQKEVDRLLNEKISEKEWKQARQFVLGNHGIEEQRLAHQASDLALSELYGLGYEDHFAFKDKLNALGVSDLQRVAQKYFSSKKQVLSVVEPAI